MKTLNEIYKSITDKFSKKTNINIERGSAIDYFVLSSSEMIKEAFDEIEKNKTPHIYTSLKGQQLDDVAILFGLTRRANESDRNFLFRITKATVSNKSSNMSAIETALMDMTHASHVTYVPHAFGCGTAGAYIIPKVIDTEGKENAINETKERLNLVTAPETYIEYIIPEVITINLTFLIKTNDADQDTIKANITKKVLEYINGIAPGSYLEIGNINKIGNSGPNVTYFNVSNVFINGSETGAVSILQKVESKFLISEDNINWMGVE